MSSTDVASRLYVLARQQGLSDEQAREFVSAGYAESSLDPNAVNKTNGAAGLFQLHSSGYRNNAQQHGGLFNVDANAGAILPQYADYFKSHPGAPAGSAGAAVEQSGLGPSFYSKDMGTVNKLLSSGHPQALEVAGKSSNTQPFQATEFSSPSAAPPTNPVDGSVNHSQLLQQTLLNWVSARNNATLAGKPLGGPGAVDLLGQLGTAYALGGGSPASSVAPSTPGATNPFAPSAPSAPVAPATSPDSAPSTPSPADPYSGKGVHTDHLVLQPGVTVQGVDPTLVNDANSLAAAIGKPLTVTSGLRDETKQAALYKRYQDSGFNRAYIAAKPGQSNHEARNGKPGEALDLTLGSMPIAKALSAALLRRYGLQNPVAGDLPHTTLLGVNG